MRPTFKCEVNCYHFYSNRGQVRSFTVVLTCSVPHSCQMTKENPLSLHQFMIKKVLLASFFSMSISSYTINLSHKTSGHHSNF